MHNRIVLFLIAICLSFGLEGKAIISENGMTGNSKDSASINKEASRPDFIHAYLLDITPGKAFYSVYGHNAIRMVCPSKQLDFCFTFEMDMKKSSYISVFTRKAKAGFAIAPTSIFFENYKKEGRGITEYEINLTPKQKQNLWRILDEEVEKGADWDFNYTSVNCLSMVFYAINKAIQPESIHFKFLPSVVKGDYTEWMDYVSRRSPWVRLIMRSVLHNVDGSSIAPEDKLSSEMVKDVMPSAVIIAPTGHERSLTKGKAKMVQAATYADKPCWFTPSMALAALLVILVMITYCHTKKKKKVSNIKNK